MSTDQSSTALQLTPRDLTCPDGSTTVIQQRVDDGYINVTQLCQAAGKRFGNWRQLGESQMYLDALSLDVGIPTSKLLITIQGRGDSVSQGTWAHPEIAIDIAAWCSVHFRIQVNRWVNEIRTQGFAVVEQGDNFAIMYRMLDQLKANSGKTDTALELGYRANNRLDQKDRAEFDAQKRRDAGARRRGSQSLHTFLWQEQSGKCADCGVPFAEYDDAEIDEIIPQSAGGYRCPANTQLLHSHRTAYRCNQRKGTAWTDYRKPGHLAHAMMRDLDGTTFHDHLRELAGMPRKPRQQALL